MPTPTPPQSVADAIRVAQDLLCRIQNLHLKIAAIHQQYGVTFLVGMVLRDLTGTPAERPAAEQPRQSLITPEMRELMEVFTKVQREMQTLQELVPAVSNATWPTSPYAQQTATVEQEFERLLIDIAALASSPAINTAYRSEMNAQNPALWSDETVNRMIAAMFAAGGILQRNGILASPGQLPRAEDPLEPLVAASTLPFPATPEAIRTELRYTPERDGTPEQYLRLLAARIRTPEQFDAYLRAMVKYDQAFNRNGGQRFLNYQRIETDQLWQHPATFLTTYNADGRLTGDCKSVALAMKAILRLQGRDAVAIESSIAQPPDALSGLVRVEGHMATIWVETVNGRLVARRLDTTTIDGSDASLISVTANDGESREDLIVRAFGEGPNHTPLYKDQLGLCTLRADGWAIDLPVTASILTQAASLERAMETGRYEDALRIVRGEIGRTPQNLNLRLAEIQLLMLATALDTEIERAVAAVEQMISTAPETRTSPANYFATRSTVAAMRRENHRVLAERLKSATEVPR